MRNRKRKNLRGLILALAVASIVAPTAQARIDSHRSQAIGTGSQPTVIVQTTPAALAPGVGFDWGDAAIGAGTAVAAATVLGGVALSRRNRQGELAT